MTRILAVILYPLVFLAYYLWWQPDEWRVLVEAARGDKDDWR